ncbi:intermembrane lipid transfer protein VPS13A-like isoform X2 [Anticarsia gemmatalis]|uniref:intermembrane lipid transfer protein VPS13A-like isoform X2 n=1 Tax=Anticarsia gemmatalis TaxID=129554 RepID=UPI003F76769E
MFEGAVAGILNRLLGKYVQDLDTENLNVGIFSGNVNLTDLKLKPEALYELDLPIDVKIGTIGRIGLQIPWTGLYTQPVVVHIEDVLVLVGPAISNSYFDPEREKRLTRAAKRKILQDLEAESEVLKGPQNFFEHLFTAIVNNIQIYVRNVHVRYEDSISSKDGPLACGLCLQSLSIETTNSKWKPCVTPANASTVYQMMRVESLSAYWNPTATALDDNETAHITPMQYYNWKHYMLTGLDKFSMHHEDFEFLLKPVTCKVKVLINRSGEARVPRLLLDAVLQDSALQLSRRQYLSINNLLASFARIKLNRKYRHLHPGVPLSKDVKKWWRYAYNVVVEQRVRPYTWAAIKKHRDTYNSYKQIYKSTLRSPNDIELKLDLQKCEDSLPIVSVVIAREQAKFELLAQEPERIEVVETEFDWWRPTSSPAESEAEESKSHVELCVKSERSKTLWSHLSSPEKKRVCELIGYVEGAPKQDKSKQYIEHKINLTLANCSLTLMNRSKEVLVVTLTQFLASLETRPSAKAYKLSARAESVVIEGVTSDGDLVPLLTPERGTGVTSSNLLAVDLEKNPCSTEADYGLCCLMEPVELVYVEHSFTELINFFQTHSMTSEELAAQVSEAVIRAGGVSRSVLAYAVSRRKVFHLNVDVKGPCVLVPEHGCVHKSGRVMILDISRIIIKSDLQPSNLTLEDATCMELEERLYDRLHAECSCQVLFCEWTEPWRESRRHADSELHLIPKIKMQVVFSNSIKKDYKLLPKYKLNISLSSFKLNLSDRIIGLLLDFCDNLPVPVPNTVPVSFMDSGDYTEDAEEPDLVELLVMDRVTADPEYEDLIKLRQKIVAAYLSRNKAAETTFDRDGAKLGFQAAQQASAASEHSDEDMEVYARSVDLPGFDDNVSPSNYINTLLRFIVGEIVINLSRSTDQTEKPYIMLSITKVCLDVALMEFGPAVQLSVSQVLLTDKQHHSSTGQYLELITSSGELFNLLYRKVRADCPEFRSHFHSVEQALVADLGHLSLLLHALALRTLVKYLQYIYDKIQNRHALNLKSVVVPKTKSLWEYMMQPEADPPVPPGATKFSYSVRASSVSIKLCHLECSVLEMRLSSLESDCVFRANDRMIFKLYLSSLHLDDLSEATLYPKLVWPDEDKVLEIKYVRAAARLYGAGASDTHSMKAHGELRVYVGRLHVVVFCCVLHHLQQFLEPLIPSSVASEAALAAERAAERQAQGMRSWSTRLNLVIEIHAPVLLLPQKPSSPNLLVLNMGDLLIENFFKQLNTGQEPSSPHQIPIIDNILIKLVNITFSRAVMTLAGTLEVQEPILEPVSIRCDMKRAVCYQQLARGGGARELLALDADVALEPVLLNVGQKDLATVLAVWTDNLSEGHYIGSIVPSSPVDSAPSDSSVKKLQAFFAQGEPIRKEAVIRFVVDGLELKLFSDMDEVLSSPVRDLNHGLAKLTAGEATFQLEYSSDSSLELKASLQSLLVEDIRPDPSIVIKRIFQSQGGTSGAHDACISVRRPPLIDASLRVTGAGARHADVRVDRTRVNLALPFLLQLARTLLDAMPGEKTMEGGVVNHGYVGDVHPSKPGNNNRAARLPSSSDSTSGYYSAANSVSEEQPGLSISIQFRQPEIMFFTDLTKTEGHALLLRTELLIDYSCHSNSESLVVSLAGLQVMSKLQSKLKNLPPQVVLKPCDVEFSKSFKNIEEGVRVKLGVSEIEVHIAATTVHTVMDIIEEITSELTIPDEKELFNFATYNPKAEKQDEDLWCPKKLTPYVTLSPDSYPQPKYPCVRPTESFLMTVPCIRLMFEMEHTVRVPVLMCKMKTEVSIHDWSGQLHGSAQLSILASCYNERVDAWEPLIEPVVQSENVYRPWEITATLFQAKAYPMSSRLDSSSQQETEADSSIASDQSRKPKKRNGFESETSADECDTDNEMTFIRNPNGRESKHYNVDFSAGHMSFLGLLDADESDSENESGLMDKLATAIGHLFTDDSSAEECSNDEDSSAPEHSEVEAGSDHEETEKAVTFTDGEVKTKKETEHKTVTLQDPVREDSVDSGLDVESFVDKTCTYIAVEARDLLNVTVTPAGARSLLDLAAACTDRTAVVTAIVTGESGLLLVNDIGPGSTVHLKTKAETDLAGNERILAIADYDVDTSRPSTPGCDTSSGDLLDEPPVKPKCEITDVSDEWDCFEGGFAAGPPYQQAACAWSPAPPAAPSALRTALTDMTLTVRLHDLDHLTILCPQRSVSKMHVLHPSKNSTRYYIVVERTSKYNNKKIVVRSPLQVRNETSYALELFYKKTDLQAIGAELIGSLTNPFDDKMRLAVIAPQETYNVPLYIAYHCKLFLLPSNFESYQTATQGIWWMELANDVGTPRDMICPAKAGDDKRIFAMRILPVEGIQSPKVSRSIPNYLIRVVPPLAIYNRLPYATDVSCVAAAWRVRVEAGERTHTYTLQLTQPHRITIDMHYMGLPWTGSFTLSPDVTEKSVTMSSSCETEGGNKQVLVCVTVERNDCWELFLHAQHWFINKTGLPLQMKGAQSDTWYEVTDEPLLWSPGARARRRVARVRVRAHHSAWSRAARLAAAAPGLVVCPHTERRTNYRLLLNVTLSELCPQLTKIVTLLPYFLVYNDTKRHLRFMEENEAADLWNDLAPQQCTPFWPQTDSMSMHCKYRDSTVVSQHFPITKNHFTVLRMDKGTAICVEVTGGTDRPFTITFKPYTPGDSPVRIENLCDDLFLKLHQVDSGQVALLSPYQSMLYTWDDPAKDRKLMWNIYNNKGKGFIADFGQDGYGEEKVSFHSVKHSTLVATSSVTSKLSSTLKRLTPKSPEPCSSSSDDSDSSDMPESHSKTKKMRKDKVIVYWISYMDGYQRVFALAQDERLASQYRMRINSERSNYEVYMSLSGVSLSVCVQTNVGVKELAYVSMTDSLPRWEVNVNHKWKQLSPDLTSWIEDKYQTEQKKCQLKEYIHIDLEKMQMTKPFFSELRRTYNPGVWMQLRKSNTYTYCHLKCQRLQIDNQLHEAVFPSVLYPAPTPSDVRSTRGLKPCIEIVALKQHRPSLNQDVYKYLKVLVQEYCVNLDRGFVNYVFDILNHWKIEEKPAVRLRADLALVHMPLPIIAIKSQINAQKNVLFEFVHLSPIKLVLSLSSRGYSAETNNSPSRTRFGNKKENRPKLFNSDLLEYLFNSWGSSLCDMKDVVLRMSYLEFRNAPITATAVVDMASRHYWTQLVQQFYVLVLGLNILGNPYSHIGDFSRGLKQYYEPYLGSCLGRKVLDVSTRLEEGAAALLGLRASPTTRTSALFDDLPKPQTPRRKPGEVPQLSNDIPDTVIDADSNNPASIALALTALVARPTFDVCREAAKASLSRQLNVNSAESALKACVERSGGRLLARRRLPRHCAASEGVRPYSQHAALGLQLLTLLGRGHYADTDSYMAHAHLGPKSNCTLLISSQHIFMVRAGGASGSWHVEWAVKLDDVIGAPAVVDDKLVLNIKQDELVNYFATDEKIIEVSDPEVLAWLKNKMECALILALEDKRCPAAE